MLKDLTPIMRLSVPRSQTSCSVCCDHCAAKGTAPQSKAISEVGLLISQDVRRHVLSDFSYERRPVATQSVHMDMTRAKFSSVKKWRLEPPRTVASDVHLIPNQLFLSTDITILLLVGRSGTTKSLTSVSASSRDSFSRVHPKRQTPTGHTRNHLSIPLTLRVPHCT